MIYRTPFGPMLTGSISTQSGGKPSMAEKQPPKWKQWSMAQRLRLRRLAFRLNSNRVVIVMMMCMLLFSEAHSIIGSHRLTMDASNWFLFSSLPKDYITAGWWLYEVEGMAKWICGCGLMVWLAHKYSSRLYVAAWVVFVHAWFVAFMFVGWYKKPMGPFWVMGAVAIGLLWAMIIPEKKQAVIKSIK